MLELELELGELVDLIEDEGDAGGVHPRHAGSASNDHSDAYAWDASHRGDNNRGSKVPNQGSCSSLLSDSSEPAVLVKLEHGELRSKPSDSSAITDWHHQHQPQRATMSHRNTALAVHDAVTRLPTTHVSAASMQLQLSSPVPPPAAATAMLTRACHKLAEHAQPSGSLAAGGSAMPSPGVGATTMDENEFDAISRPPVSHSSVEKQRRDRLNGLIEKLATIVPLMDEHSQPTSPTGSLRRPKHVVLADTIRMLCVLQEHMQQCPHAAAPPLPASCTASLPSSASPALAPLSEPPLLAVPGTARSNHTSATGQLSCFLLDMPLPLDMAANTTGVMVEAPVGSATWRLRVTCRDRPGLLADVAVALRALPVNVTHASVTTTSKGKAQQVFEVAVLDASLAPEEIQCAVNAALYAHLLPGSNHGASGTATNHLQGGDGSTHAVGTANVNGNNSLQGGGGKRPRLA